MGIQTDYMYLLYHDLAESLKMLSLLVNTLLEFIF